jgi:hypothetical protein
MKKAHLITTAVCLLIGAAIFVSTALAQGKASPKQDWSGLKIVVYENDVTGFFDPASGKMYFYDSNMNCKQVRQLEELGRPLKQISMR